MSKILVLAEKPSVGRDIARVLNCRKGSKGFIEGDKYIVTWALGHLVTLAEPEKYNKGYKEWKIDDLPILPSKMKLTVIRQSQKQFYTVKEQMARRDVKEIIIATDAGREGELVARWILEKAKIRKPIKRLWISSVTDKAIRDGFKNLKDGRNFNKLYESALARAEADWIVGINGTRALTVKHNVPLSLGRVQTPTLAMVAQREEERRNFKPRNFYGISAQTKDIGLIWRDSSSGETRTFDKDRADSLVQSLRGKDARVSQVEARMRRTYPPKLYDLTTLQRDGNRIFGFSARETLSIMQRLYENHKIVSYPRTDSRYLSDDIVPSLKDRIRACNLGEYRKFAAKLLKGPIKANKSFVDNSKLTDHHAIIPTEERVPLSRLSDGERKIYDLVVRNFLAVLHPPYEYEETTITAKIGQEDFIARGRLTKRLGWKALYSQAYLEDEGRDEKMPQIKKGDRIKVISIKQNRGQTSPPPSFNEGSLLGAMENPVGYMKGESRALKEIIGQTGGIGTVATRADIIERLFTSFLIEKNGQDINITSKGRQLLGLVPEALKSPALTAEWEEKLSLISQAKLDKNKFINEMRDYSKEIVEKIKSSQEEYRHDNLTRAKCPECGKFMLEVKTKNSRLYVCQDRECNYRRTISKTTNARCPRCRKRMELREQGKEQIFTCVCGYREKLSSFNARKSKEKSMMSKGEVKSYLKDQKKSKKEPINTGLQDALSKLKLDL